MAGANAVHLLDQLILPESMVQSLNLGGVDPKSKTPASKSSWKIVACADAQPNALHAATRAVKNRGRIGLTNCVHILEIGRAHV